METKYILDLNLLSKFTFPLTYNYETSNFNRIKVIVSKLASIKYIHITLEEYSKEVGTYFITFAKPSEVKDKEQYSKLYVIVAILAYCLNTSLLGINFSSFYDEYRGIFNYSRTRDLFNETTDRKNKLF